MIAFWANGPFSRFGPASSSEREEFDRRRCGVRLGTCRHAVVVYGYLATYNRCLAVKGKRELSGSPQLSKERHLDEGLWEPGSTL